ncbi:MAG TPA: glycerophosphodiester phosphodiesterase family protein [Paenibacillaceae bacterium]
MNTQFRKAFMSATMILLTAFATVATVRQTAARSLPAWSAAWTASTVYFIPSLFLSSSGFPASAALSGRGVSPAEADSPAPRHRLSSIGHLPSAVVAGKSRQTFAKAAPSEAEPTAERSGSDKADRWPYARPWIIAHRGVSMHAPENTFAAFDLALREGADFIELDVRRSRDGRLVVIHDATVDRTTDGRGRVADLSWDVLNRLDAGSWFGPSFAGQPLPLLEEVLDRYAGKIGLLVELKDPDAEDELAALLTARGLMDGIENRLIVQSFHPESMRRLRNLLPKIQIGVLTGQNGRKPSEKDLDHFAGFADFINVRLDTADARLVQRIHRRGALTLVWTVKYPGEVAPLLKAGVDGIVTDDPALVPRNADNRKGRPSG